MYLLSFTVILSIVYSLAGGCADIIRKSHVRRMKDFGQAATAFTLYTTYYFLNPENVFYKL